jgi:hypothetical protein
MHKGSYHVNQSHVATQYSSQHGFPLLSKHSGLRHMAISQSFSDTVLEPARLFAIF